MADQEKKPFGGSSSIAALIARLALTLTLFFCVLAAMLFGLAGTWDYPGAWICLILFLAIASIVFIFYLRKDPEFLRKRFDYKEREKPQRAIVSLTAIPLVAIFAVPALDRRFGWTPFSWTGIALGLALFGAGYAALLAVFSVNRYAARTVRLQEGQKVIDRGPYAIVRHPMYSAIPFIYAGIPLILQSPWGILPLPLVMAGLVARILNEERLLRAGLPGYEEYVKRVKWRLVPFLW
jgi:protein-S-isoprenylcysteine O-methyltransferase Ste14